MICWKSSTCRIVLYMHVHVLCFLLVILQLHRLFRKYAKKYPRLGMTPEELKSFLISECYVSRETMKLHVHMHT